MVVTREWQSLKELLKALVTCICSSVFANPLSRDQISSSFSFKPRPALPGARVQWGMPSLLTMPPYPNRFRLRHLPDSPEGLPPVKISAKPRFQHVFLTIE